MLTVTLYTQEGCQLCEEAEKTLNSLQDQYPHKLILVDVEEENLVRKLGEEIPIVEVGPYQVKAPFNQKTLQMTLGAAQDRVDQLESVGDDLYQKRKERAAKISFADRFFNWFSRQYMWVFNFFVFLYLGLAFLAPVLQRGGFETPANVIYGVYGRLCHQLSFRSWFLYGEQVAYPRETANVDWLTPYEQATGLDPSNLQDAHEFVGNQTLGYKLALCQRDIAIYGSILLFGVLFAVTGRKIKPLSVAGWLLIGILPIGLDGVSQLVSQLPLDFIPYRESTPFLRTLTGFLFGFSTAWFGYPLVEEAMADTRKVMTVKYAAVEGEDA